MSLQEPRPHLRLIAHQRSCRELKVAKSSGGKKRSSAGKRRGSQKVPPTRFGRRVQPVTLVTPQPTERKSRHGWETMSRGACKECVEGPTKRARRRALELSFSCRSFSAFLRQTRKRKRRVAKVAKDFMVCMYEASWGCDAG